MRTGRLWITDEPADDPTDRWYVFECRRRIGVTYAIPLAQAAAQGDTTIITDMLWRHWKTCGDECPDLADFVNRYGCSHFTGPDGSCGGKSCRCGVE